MTSVLDANVHNLAVGPASNFDECQAMVKQVCALMCVLKQFAKVLINTKPLAALYVCVQEIEIS